MLPSLASPLGEVVVVELKGVVMVRRGVEEEWVTAKRGLHLYRLDTIETEKRASVKLTIGGRRDFVLPEEAILEISDLEEMTKEELLLFLVEQNVARTDAREKGIKLGGSSIPRGRMEPEEDPLGGRDRTDLGVKRFNGIQSLFEHGYLTNAIAGFKKLLLSKDFEKSAWRDHAQYLIAESFRGLGWHGRAIKAYEGLLQAYPQSGFRDEAHKKIEQEMKEL
jgi:hypothetical protein